MQAETTIYFGVWWVLFEFSSFDHFPQWEFSAVVPCFPKDFKSTMLYYSAEGRSLRKGNTTKVQENPLKQLQKTHAYLKIALLPTS